MKNCKFCDKKGLWLYVQLYGVVAAANASDLAALPALSGTLGSGVADIPLAANARYAVRQLRPGFVYVLIERQGVRYWQAYRVIEGGYLHMFDAQKPAPKPEAFNCERNTCGIGASVVSIDDVDTVDNVWLLFTPAEMTLAKLKEYRENAPAYAGQGKMQHFNARGWVHGKTTQPHALKPEALMSTAAEFILYRQHEKAQTSPLGVAMSKLMFPAESFAYAGTPPRQDGSESGFLGVMAQKLVRQKGAVVVLYDHIGITQELNDFRNAPIEGLEHYLAATDEFGASNQHRLQIYEAIEEIKAGMHAGVVASTQQFQDFHQRSSDQYFERRRNQARTMRAQGMAAEAAAVEADIERSLKTRAANYRAQIESVKAEAAEDWKDKYASRLDTAEMAAFHAALQSRSKAAFDLSASRMTDHLKWFESDRVVNAFDVFDKRDKASGYNFAVESAACSFGLSSCKAGEDKIDAWIKAPQVERKNLYVRGLYNNSDELIAAAKQSFLDIQTASENEEFASAIGSALMLKATKGLVDGFKKVDSAFDEWARNQGQAYSVRWGAGREIMLYHKFSDVTRTVFRTGVGGVFDKKLAAWLSGWLYARLGEVTEALAFSEAMLTIPKEQIASHRAARAARRAEARRMDKAADKAAKVAQQVDGSLEKLISDARDKTRQKALTLKQIQGAAANDLPTNNYHHTRLGVVLGCLEMLALGEKMSHFENDTKGWLEVGGSLMAVGSIVLDTYYSAAKSIREIKPYRDIKPINRAADVVRGRFKLGAGVLGAGAGLCAATLDWMKVASTDDRFLKGVYVLRGATGFVSAGFTLAAAFSYCSPMLEHAARGYATHSVRYRVLIWSAGRAAALAARVRLLVWVARLNWIGLTFTALEIGYLLLRDNDLQNWCEMCVFRKDKKYQNWLGYEKRSDKFDGAVKELEALDRAAQAVGLGA